MPDETPLADPTSSKFTPICAIGASAGGVTALQALFRQLPSDLGLAYVIVLHLSPDQPSALKEVLGVCTRMSVHQVQDHPTVEPDCVYVIAPGRELVIEGDHISSRPFSEPRSQRAPIDMFFRSVARARGDGVAIILSGSGADGAHGVRSVKEAGGVVMVQEPAEAEFASMPQSAIATGAADFVAPVARLAERLREVAHSKEAVRTLEMEGAANDLRRIVQFLRARTGHDFSSYKRATVLRRVLRRMQVVRTDSLAAYFDYLQATPEEAKRLFSDLLISVTMFFRDPRSFEALARLAINPILDQVTDEGVRAWTVGCATGEEAYSLAILFLEACEERKLHVPVQIFATDLDEGALVTAREGRYSRTIEADVSPERLSRFFVDEGTHYRIRKQVRETVLFAHHSVLKEPPFMRLDLISCRNLLIYLERSLQQQLGTLFHYCLKRGHYLFLGSAETTDTSSELFAPLDREGRVYCARPDASRSHLPLLPQFPSPERLAARHPPPPTAGPEHLHLTSAQHVAALEMTAPPTALVDAGQNIVHLSPNAGRYLLHSGGPVSSLLSAVVRPELRLDLRLALTRALEQGLSTSTHPAVVGLEGERRRVSLFVTPVPRRPQEGVQALIYFLDSGPITVVVPDGADEGRPDEVRRLHAELKSTQEALVASRSRHDATIEDLRAANEELQSTNEEYRSTAEELETSREELQSINEELHTVASELKSKLDHLSSAHSDLQNLTAATDIGVLFLDAELLIKMFTPTITGLFNITRSDVGRSITDFTSQLDQPPLAKEFRQVVAALAPIEREVQSTEGRCFMLKIRPYRTLEDRIEGVVLTFVDITARIKMEQALSRSEQQFRALVRASAQVLYRMSPDWTEMRELSGGAFLSTLDRPTQSWADLYIPDEDRSRVQAAIDNAIATKGVFDLEHRVVRADGAIGWTHSRAIPLFDADGEIEEWFGSADDITARHRD